jgi:hypothetical protein
MPKGQTSNKQSKKPKADPKLKGAGSAYKQSQDGAVSATVETFKKKKK